MESSFVLNTASEGHGSRLHHSVAIQCLGHPETLDHQLGQHLRKEEVDPALKRDIIKIGIWGQSSQIIRSP